MSEKIKIRSKVVVAMSGGIDSSVAAALLKKQGFDVIGIFMKFWSEPRGGSRQINADSNPGGKPSASYGAGADLRRYENRCCSSEAETRARKVAQVLKIPFYVLNFEKEFKKRVVDYFLEGQQKGITPNPCVVCNRDIKFGLLMEKAMVLGADYLATGHYARLENKGQGTRLLKGIDRKKDQSYFLWMLNQKQLRQTLFPVGRYTKTEVRRLAEKMKLPFFSLQGRKQKENIRESQEICFVAGKIEEFLAKYLEAKPGKILDTKRKILGKHRGLAFYTIGQRKGIKLPQGPYFVLKKSLKKNFLIVTKNEKDLYKQELHLYGVHWISGERPKLPLKLKIKIRYRQITVPATLYSGPKGNYQLIFTRGQRAITPGQSAVFFKNDEVLGGGIIK